MNTKHVENVRTYLIVYAMLVALLIATIVAAIFDFGAVGLTIAMGIAVPKGCTSGSPGRTYR